ncbi:SAM-dependent methyltransferase [Nocardiopsis coralliicola]
MADPVIDTSVSHPARIWDYWLGGKDNFAADRETGEAILAAIPDMRANARANRGFLGRAVRHLAAEAGVRQFLDIGTGIPGPGNTHEAAQSATPDARVVYVDNDPVVLAHARALLVGQEPGSTDYIHADLREPEAILERAGETLDLSRPVAVTLLAILEFIPDNAQTKDIIDRLMAPLPAGSHVVLSVATTEVRRENAEKGARIWNESGSTPMLLRTGGELAAFFDGYTLLEPGVVSCTDWRPDGPYDPDARVAQYCGVARKD